MVATGQNWLNEIRNQQVAGSIPAGGSSLKLMVCRPATGGSWCFCQQFCQQTTVVDLMNDSVARRATLLSGDNL